MTSVAIRPVCVKVNQSPSRYDIASVEDIYIHDILTHKIQGDAMTSGTQTVPITIWYDYI